MGGGRGNKRKVHLAPRLEETQGRRKSAPPSSHIPAPMPRTNPSVSTNEEQGTVRAVRGEAKDGGV